MARRLSDWRCSKCGEWHSQRARICLSCGKLDYRRVTYKDHLRIAAEARTTARLNNPGAYWPYNRRTQHDV